MEDGITGAYVGEEGVSQALALGGAFDQTGDIHDIQERRHLAIKTHIDRYIESALNSLQQLAPRKTRARLPVIKC